MTKRFAPATQRNRTFILDVLKKHVRPGERVLEIASGSGEHAMYLAPALDVSSWQPSDPSPESRASIDAWCTDLPQISPAIEIDVTKPPDLGPPDVIVCINMIHIAPWEATLGLLDLASALLAPGKVLYLYGPYKRSGAHTAPSNEAFDQSLRATDPSWGVRDLDDVTREASSRGFERIDVVEMPANNLSVVFRKAQP